MKFVTSRRIRNSFPRYIANYFMYQTAFNKVLSLISSSEYDYVLNIENTREEDLTPVNVVSSLAGHQIASDKDPFYPLISHCKSFTHDDLLQNPYYRNIRLEGCDYGDFKVISVSDRQYEFFLWNDVVCEKLDGLDSFVPCIGIWKDVPAPYYVLQDREGNAWMSITFNEIFTMQPSIDEARGKVLTLGCGLGYYAYMVAIKPDVESVTIVEQNQSVIDLLNQKILPQFGDAKAKVRIVKADAFEFIPTVQNGEYDYCFADIWDGIRDEKRYYALRKMCGSEYRGMKMSYWIEKGFLGQIATGVKDVLMEAFALAEQNKDWMQLAAPAKFLRESDQYTFFTVADNMMKDVVIKSMEDIDFYWNFENVKKLYNENYYELIP